MATGDTLASWEAPGGTGPNWIYVKFTSGSTEPSLGDTIWGVTSDASAVLEYLVLTSGDWGGTAAGYMLLSASNGVDFSDAEAFNNISDVSSADHGTMTAELATAFATPDLRGVTPTLDFDDSVNEVALFAGVMPRNYGGTTGITVRIGIMAETATTADTSWAVFFKSVSDDVDDLDIKNFAAPQVNAAVVAPSASGEVKYFDVDFDDGAEMDSIAVGEYFEMLVMRDAQDGTNDDMTGDAELVSVEIRER